MAQISDLEPVREFQTSGGARIFRLPVEAFPGFWAYAYLVLVEEYVALIDTGSGFGSSNDHLDAGIEAAGDLFGRQLSLADLTHVLITHSHIDHFGGLVHIREKSPAKVGIHELDQRTLVNYEERLVIVSRRLARFLAEAGVPAEKVKGLLDLYNLTKSLFRSVPVDFTYEAEGLQLGPFEMLHVPGHCAGHVVIRLHDVLFSGDHVLEGISPHQAPESLTMSTGLNHYLQSLAKLLEWAPGIQLTLGGHNKPVEDLPARIQAIQSLHADRLDQVLGLLDEPHTIAEISRALFGKVSGYNVLLALEEAGAHVEFLYQRGALEIANLSDLQSNPTPVAVRYRRISPQPKEPGI